MKSITTLALVVGTCLLPAFVAGTTQTQTAQVPVEPSRLICQTQIGYGQYVAGARCFMNQVLVGAQNGYLICAPIQVNCYYRDTKSDSSAK